MGQKERPDPVPLASTAAAAARRPPPDTPLIPSASPRWGEGCQHRRPSGATQPNRAKSPFSHGGHRRRQSPSPPGERGWGEGRTSHNPRAQEGANASSRRPLGKRRSSRNTMTHAGRAPHPRPFSPRGEKGANPTASADKSRATPTPKPLSPRGREVGVRGVGTQPRRATPAAAPRTPARRSLDEAKRNPGLPGNPLFWQSTRGCSRISLSLQPGYDAALWSCVMVCFEPMSVKGRP